MLRAILLASPVVLTLMVSCTGSDTADFKDDGPASSGTAGSGDSSSGASAGGTSAQAGNNATAGSNATAGKGNTAGNGNTGGNQTTGGNSNGGAPPDGGAQSDGGTNAAGTNAGGTNAAGTNAGGNGNGGNNTGGTNGGNNTGGNGGNNTGGGGNNTGGTNGGPLCPDIFGPYTIVNVDGGQACNGVTKNAMQSIQGTDVACFAHFVSLAPNPGGPTGVNGGAALDQNGNFTGAALYLNKTQRAGCSGKWDQNNERVTIKCGGGGEQCTIVMDRD